MLGCKVRQELFSTVHYTLPMTLSDVPVLAMSYMVKYVLHLPQVRSVQAIMPKVSH
jgi:hypothetical protein